MLQSCSRGRAWCSTADDGLTLVLAGGPPPRRVTVCHVAQGTTGKGVRRTALATRLSQVDAPDLARRLARHTASDGHLPAALPAEFMGEIAATWPAKVS